VLFVKGPANTARRSAVAIYMVGMYGVARMVRRVTRLADKMYRLPRKRRRRAGSREKPVGPRLVRGRGRPRSRLGSRLGGLVVYLVLAAGLTVFLFKYLVTPFLTR
jgi:hypothetical protein